MNAEDKERIFTAMLRLDKVILNVMEDGVIEIIDHATGKTVEGVEAITTVGLRINVGGLMFDKPRLEVKGMTKPGDGVIWKQS